MAKPYRRGKTWAYTYYTRDVVTGERVQHRKGGFATEEEAQAHMDATNAEIEAGKYQNGAHLTLEAYLNRWFEVHKQTVEPATASGYQKNITNHIIPWLGKTKLTDLNKQQLTAFYTRLYEQKKLSPTTIKYVNSVLRKALNDAMDDGLILRNPTHSAKRPKMRKYHAEVLDARQIKTLIEGCMGTEYELEFLLAITLGLRRGEVLGLRFSDFDLDNNTVHIQQQISIASIGKDGKQKFGIKELKTEGSNRVLYVPQAVIESLKRRRMQINLNKLKYGQYYMDLDLICCDINGLPKTPNRLNTHFKQLLKDLGLPDIRFHDLRHSYATAMIDLDVPLKVISQNLGHSTIAITADIYCDVIDKKKLTADLVQNTFFDSNESQMER